MSRTMVTSRPQCTHLDPLATQQEELRKLVPTPLCYPGWPCQHWDEASRERLQLLVAPLLCARRMLLQPVVVYRGAQSHPSTFWQFENIVPRQFTFDPSSHGTCKPVSASTSVTRHPAIEATLQAKTLLKDLVALHSPLASRMCPQPWDAAPSHC